MFDQFFTKFGYDGNSVKLYDDLIIRIATDLNCRVYPSEHNISDIVRTQNHLLCTFKDDAQTLFSLPVPIGSMFGPEHVSGYTKGSFIIRGLKYAFVSIDQPMYAYPMVINKRDVIICSYYTMVNNTTIPIKAIMDSTRILTFVINGERMNISDIFAYIEQKFGILNVDIRARFKLVCTTLANDNTILLYICNNMADVSIENIKDVDKCEPFTAVSYTHLRAHET